MKTAQSLKEIVDHHFNGGKFLYDSYDHKQAEAEFKQTEMFKDLLRQDFGFTENSKIDKFMIPEDIRSKWAILKPGKLRSIDFNPHGGIRSIKLGNKRAVTFYEWTANNVELLTS